MRFGAFVWVIDFFVGFVLLSAVAGAVAGWVDGWVVGGAWAGSWAFSSLDYCVWHSMGMCIVIDGLDRQIPRETKCCMCLGRGPGVDCLYVVIWIFLVKLGYREPVQGKYQPPSLLDFGTPLSLPPGPEPPTSGINNLSMISSVCVPKPMHAMLTRLLKKNYTRKKNPKTDEAKPATLPSTISQCTPFICFPPLVGLALPLPPSAPSPIIRSINEM